MSDSPAIQMYRTSSCPFCIMAAELLKGHGIQFEEISLDGHPDRRKVTSDILPGHDTVPLIVVDGEPIGGFDELQRLRAAGELETRLRGTG